MHVINTKNANYQFGDYKNKHYFDGKNAKIECKNAISEIKI